MVQVQCTLTILEQNQGNVSRSIRIVFQTFNNSWNINFIPFKINDTVVLLMTTTDMTCCYTPLIISTATFTIFTQQRCKWFAFMQLIILDAYYKP